MSAQIDGKVIKVLIGQVSLTRAPNLLQSVLGSCIGLVLYDPQNGIAGMAHILLPNSAGRASGGLPGKYADRAVPCLYQALLKYGGVPDHLKAKMAGGARMFKSSMDYKQGDVGGSNVEAVVAGLEDLHIPLVAKSVGGDLGRKIEFSPQSFKLTVEDFSQKVQVL